MSLPLVIQKNGTIYFYKNIAEEEKENTSISKYLKETTVQLQYTDKLEVYKIEDFSIVSLILNSDEYINEFIGYLQKYSYNEIPSSLINHIRKIEQDMKVVRLELGKTEIIIRVMKGDLSFLTLDKKINDKIIEVKKEHSYTYPREYNYKLVEYLADKKVSMVFPYIDVNEDIEFKFKETINLRYYQKQAFDSLANRKNGLTIMPVASGKTYVAIKLIEHLGKRTLILCENKDNCSRWKHILLKFLDISAKDISICVDDTNISEIGKINIYSYDVLRSSNDKSMFERLYNNNWGVIIYDNAHKAVTEKSIDLLYLKAKYKFAFDSTINRSDGRERSLLNLFGGIAYYITSGELVNNLYEKRLECYKVDLRKLSISKEEFIEKVSKKIGMRSLVVVAHGEDDINRISKKLRITSLYNKTSNEERIRVAKEFSNRKINRLCISNLIEKYTITNIDVMIAAGYRGSKEIEENFRIGTLVSTELKLPKVTTAQMFYLIKNEEDYKFVCNKEKSLYKYKIIFKVLDVSKYLGDDHIESKR